MASPGGHSSSFYLATPDESADTRPMTFRAAHQPSAYYDKSPACVGRTWRRLAEEFLEGKPAVAGASEAVKRPARSESAAPPSNTNRSASLSKSAPAAPPLRTRGGANPHLFGNLVSPPNINPRGRINLIDEASCSWPHLCIAQRPSARATAMPRTGTRQHSCERPACPVLR